MANLTALIALSRLYGADPDWVLAGGGNTSYKEKGQLYVKASGTALGTVDESGFCSMDRTRLDAMWDASYPVDTEAREAAALADLMAARRAACGSRKAAMSALRAERAPMAQAPTRLIEPSK